MNEKLLHEILTKCLNINCKGKYKLNYHIKGYYDCLDIFNVIFDDEKAHVEYLFQLVSFENETTLQEISDKLSEMLEEA